MLMLFGGGMSTKGEQGEADEISVPYCSPIGKIGTFVLHCGVCGGLWALMHASGQAGDTGLQICATHIGFLLGLVGPKPGRFKHFWVPSPVHEVDGAGIFLLLGLLEYVGVGMIAMFQNEGNEATNPGGAFIESGDNSFVDRLWFLFVLLTTVGYGNTFTPTTPSSRQYSAIWALYGLFIFGAGSNVVINIVGKRIDEIKYVLSKLTPKSTAAVAPEVKSDAPFEPSSLYFAFIGLFKSFIAFVVLNVGGALIFQQLEPTMTYVDAFYHCAPAGLDPPASGSSHPCYPPCSLAPCLAC